MAFEKQAISVELINRALTNRRNRILLWSALGKLRGLKDNTEILEFAAERARARPGIRDVYSALRGTEAATPLAGGVRTPTQDQIARIFAGLLNRTASDPQKSNLVRNLASRLGVTSRYPGGYMGARQLALRPEGERLRYLGRAASGRRQGEIGYKLPSGHRLDFATSPSPFAAHIEGLYHPRARDTYKPLTAQFLDEDAKYGLWGTIADSPHKFWGGLNDSLAAKGIIGKGKKPKVEDIADGVADYLKKVQDTKLPTLGSLPFRFPAAASLLPRWTGISTFPGHPEVQALYSRLGFMPVEVEGSRYLLRPGGRLPKKQWAAQVDERLRQVTPGVGSAKELSELTKQRDRLERLTELGTYLPETEPGSVYSSTLRDAFNQWNWQPEALKSVTHAPGFAGAMRKTVGRYGIGSKGRDQLDAIHDRLRLIEDQMDLSAPLTGPLNRADVIADPTRAITTFLDNPRISGALQQLRSRPDAVTLPALRERVNALRDLYQGAAPEAQNLRQQFA
jgi:hypothetical protein